MSTKELIDSAVEHLHAAAGAKTVYGDPLTIDGRTIIPVARVAYGFGGGTGTKKAGDGEPGNEGEGAGGGISAKPVGVVEVDQHGARFVPVAQTKKLAIAALIGAGVGLVVGVMLRGRGART